MYLSDGYPQATARLRCVRRACRVYLSDGYPQATAAGFMDGGGGAVYLSDGYPQATAGKRRVDRRLASVSERRLPAGHSCSSWSSPCCLVYLSDGYPQATAWVNGRLVST